MTKTERVAIYSGTMRVGIIEAPTSREAWRAAVSYVRASAHADGVEGGTGWERPRGRHSYGRGIFRAVTERRVDP